MRHKLGYSSFSGIGQTPQAEGGKGPTRPLARRPATDPNTACADRAAALLIGGNEGGDGGRHEWRLRAPVPPRDVSLGARRANRRSSAGFARAPQWGCWYGAVEAPSAELAARHRGGARPT